MPVEIPLTKGYVALVDEADAAWVLTRKWYASDHKDGRVYAATGGLSSNGEPRTVRMHRLILGDEAGPRIDHRDHNGLNNQRHNLRRALSGQNTFNQRRERSWMHNKHGFRGVAFITNSGLYHGRVTVSGRQFYTRGFHTAFEAAVAWDTLAIEHFGEFALTSLNFPERHAIPNTSAPAAHEQFAHADDGVPNLVEAA